MAGKKRDQASWLRYSGVGIEFAGVVGLFTAAGYWVDDAYGSGPWGLLLGAGVGLIGGTFRLIRQAMEAFGPTNQPGDEKE